jgi:NADH-quinone oxidoreductase subunit J
VIPALFAGFAAVLLASALMVVLHRNPVTSALFLVVAFCSLAGIYIVMRAEFIGMVQVIVYAGAIMVLFVFVIMYLNLGRDPERGATILLRRMIGWFVGAMIVLQGVLLFAGRWALGPVQEPPDPRLGNTQALGQALYSRFLYPFEITSLVLLVAMVGAIVISKGRGGYEPVDRAAAPRVTLRPGDSLTPPGGPPA